MNDDFGQALVEFGELSESILLTVELSNLFRDASITIDRAIDPLTGLLISDLAARVVQVKLSGLQDLTFTNNLSELMWGPEANWGLNEMIAVELSRMEDHWKVALLWSGNDRRFEFQCQSVLWQFLPSHEAETTLKAFWGNNNWQ